MKLGFGLPTGGTTATVENVTVLARHAEALGYCSLWVFQRLLCPVAPLNGYYGTPNGPWPGPFRSTLDPTVTLAFLAATTTRVWLGTSVLAARCHPPIALACGGRGARSRPGHRRLARIVPGAVHAAGAAPERLLRLAAAHSR